MSLYFLDTDILTLYQLKHAAVLRHVAGCELAALAITIVSVEEQLSGWYRLLRQAKKPDQLALAYQRMTTAIRSLSRLEILTFTESAIQRYLQLQTLRLNIGKNDLRIAAIALENNAIVVTRNRTDFQRVPGLVIEDWSQ